MWEARPVFSNILIRFQLIECVDKIFHISYICPIVDFNLAIAIAMMSFMCNISN